eukprot:scaffold6011_cov188-Prasinococcus_capsulatus_cf.AAC.1
MTGGRSMMGARAPGGVRLGCATRRATGRAPACRSAACLSLLSLAGRGSVSWRGVDGPAGTPRRAAPSPCAAVRALAARGGGR